MAKTEDSQTPSAQNMDEVQRKHPLAECENCSWFQRGKYADSDGPTDATLLVIGEAPGKQEAREGKVFVGPSGQLLEKVLKHHGYDRSKVRFTNAVACSPPNIQSKGASAPPKEVLRACEPRLRQELSNRETVILAGATAFKTVMETTEAITKARQGPPRTHPSYPNTKFVPTVHPAACLRSSDYFPSLVRDIKKVRSADIYVKWEPPVFRTYDDRESGVGVLDELLRVDSPYITVDIETPSEKDTDFAHPSYLLSVGIGYAPNKAIVLGETALSFPDVKEKLEQLLKRKNIVYHNGKFDAQVLMRLGILDASNIWADTMLASYCIDERPGHHGLKGLSSEILGAPDYEAELKPHIGRGAKKDFSLAPKAILYRYNAYDAALTYNLWKHFEHELDEQNLRGLHDYLVDASNELIYAELDGIAIDEPYLETLIEEYGKLLNNLENDLKPWVDNPRSWQQVGRALDKLGMGFAPDTAADTLNSLLEGKRTEEQREFLEKLLLYRKEQKLFGTYIQGPKKRALNGRVYPTYLVHGTVTGRLSSRNPNAQNISRNSKIKKIYVPTEGNIFIQGDYSQAELRVIACLAQDKYFQEVYCDSTRDIHSETAELFYGPNFTKEERVMAKTFNFGVAYGRGPHAVAEAFGVDLATAQRYVNQFLARIPDTVRWRKQVHDRVFKGGQALQTPFGRKRRFWLITRDNKVDIQNESLAFFPQSVASDLCLSSLIKLRKAFGYGPSTPKVRTTVHDSILVECPNEIKDEVAQEMKRIMMTTAAEVFSDFVPFDVDIEVGKSWGELHKIDG